VKFLLDPAQGEYYKARFVKLSYQWRKDYVVPSMDRCYIGDVYVREPDFELYVANTMAERLLLNKKEKFRIIPINFWKEEYGKELPEFDEVRYVLLQTLHERKLKKKKPGDYVFDAF
jgi:hypothetical protein